MRSWLTNSCLLTESGTVDKPNLRATEENDEFKGEDAGDCGKSSNPTTVPLLSTELRRLCKDVVAVVVVGGVDEIVENVGSLVGVK